MDCSLPGPSVPEILQTRILDWVVTFSSRGLSDPGIEPTSPALADECLTTELPEKTHSLSAAAAAAAAKSLQSCPTLCDPIDGSPPGSPIPGILQTRILEWVAISFSSA